MLKKMCKISQDFSNLGFISCFVGPFTQDLIAEMGTSLRDTLKEQNKSSSVAVKVFSIVIELSQNILHYSSEIQPYIDDKTESDSNTTARVGMLAVGKQDEAYYVLSGNLIERDKQDSLAAYLDSLNQLDRKALRGLYSEKRRKGPGPDSKGAGLGFIELARKASKPIEFGFHQVDDQHSFFSVKIKV